MPEKHPNTHRWGGPGASHEDRTKPMPEEQVDPRPEGPEISNPRVSQVSGGGGEPDEKHSHVDGMRSSKSHATDSPSPTSPRTWRQNRSRRSREAELRESEGNGEVESGEADDAAASEELQVLVNTDDNIQGKDALTASVERQVAQALKRFAPRLTRVEVFLADENASKTGPGDKRCSIEARPKGRDAVAASDRGSTIDAAVSGAAAKLTRLLNTELGRLDNRKGGDSIRPGR